MKHKIKLTILVLLCVTAIFLITGCGAEPTPYETNNADDYTVSVRFDANGGQFTTNTYTIVDSFNIKNYETNSEGMVEVPLITPDNPARGNDAFAPINNGYFLAGWYSVRNESTDSDGNKVYTYSEKWDFENGMLAVDPTKEYVSEEPVLTLYAAWVPLFEIEFYSLDTGELLETFAYDPMATDALAVPYWDEETGTVEMNRFPERKGYTFKQAYYDSERTTPIITETVEHAGSVDYTNGTAVNHVQKVYIEWTEGEWYRIYTAEQFADNASLDGNYEILADLDFTDEIWPTSFMYGNFSGSIIGNGHTIKNVNVTQTNNAKTNAGLFGVVAENASISDITFENITFTIKAGTRVAGASYGIFAGAVSDGAALNNLTLSNSKLLVDPSCYFGVDDYSIGLVCGMGNDKLITSQNVTCGVAGVATGDEHESVTVTADGNTVTVKFAE